MKRTNRALFLFIALLLLTAYAHAQTADFVTVWKTDNPGTSASNQIRIYTNAAIDRNFTVRWGDGTMNSGAMRDITHTYATPGTYTVRISGEFHEIDVHESGDQLKLLSINQWGIIEWFQFFHAFDGCANMVLNTTAPPKMAPYCSCQYMFKDCTLFNTNINAWDMTDVIATTGMFANCKAFNQPLNNWDVKSFQSTGSMFYGCIKFNQPLNNWKLVRTESVAQMFDSAIAFNSALFDPTSLSACQEFQFMFADAVSFNQPIPAWTTSSLVYAHGMFYRARSFNQPLLFYTGNARNMVAMLDGCGMNTTNYDATIESWKRDVTQINNVGASGLKYCSASASRNYLKNTWGWTFNGDGIAAAINLSSAAGTSSQSLCINTPLTTIQYTTTNVATTGFSGLPPGISGSYNASTGTVLISGTPTQTGTFNYTINTLGSCGVSATGTITVQGPTVNAGPALMAVCPSVPTAALGGSFGGTATAAVWSEVNPSPFGLLRGTFSNNTGSTPQSAVYTPSFFAANPIALRLTTSGGACGTAFAEKPIVINDTAVWLGATNQWEQPTNWSKGAIPGACTVVVVNAGTAYPPRVTGLNNTCYKLILRNGINVTVAANAKLFITGN